MAASGSKSISVTSYDTLKFSWEETSQSTTNNTTTVSWKMQLIAASGGRISSTVSKDWSVTVNGTKYSGTNTVGIGNNETKTLASGKTTITHDSNGKKTFSYSFSQQFSITFSEEYIGTKTGSGTGTLTTIPRTSSVSMETGTLGKESSVTINAASTSFTHTLKFYFGDKTKTIVEKTSKTSVSWTPPLSWAEQVLNSTYDTGTLRCITYSGDTKIGQKDVNVKLKVPSSVKPTISGAINSETGLWVNVDNSANSVVKKWGEYVVNYSKAKITVVASGIYNSTISSFKIEGGYSTTKKVTDFTDDDIFTYTGSKLTSSGEKTFTVTAIDSRGISSNVLKSSTINVCPYSDPKITKFKVYRGEGSNASKIMVEANWSFSSVNGKNKTTGTVYYKKSSSDTWGVNDFVSIENGKTTSLTEDFDTASSYNFKLVVKDELDNQDQDEYFISTMDVLMDFRAGGKGLGIGKVCESDSLEVDMQSKFFQNIYIDDECEIRSLDSEGNSRSILKGISSEGNTILGYTNYTDADANTNIYGNQIWLYSNDGVHSKSRIVMPNNTGIRGKTTDGVESSMLFLSDSNNTSLGYGGYKNDNGNTYIYGQDVHLHSANGGNTYVVPYFRAGDELKHIWYGAGFVRGDGYEVCFTIPLNKPVLENTTVTVSTNGGFILRQDGKYTHGSNYTNDTWVYKKSGIEYEEVVLTQWGVRIKAVFNDNTNAINKSEIGIYWSGIIEFY